VLSLRLYFPHFPVTNTAETSLSHPVVSDWEEPCLKVKEGNWQTVLCMNCSSSCSYLGVYLLEEAQELLGTGHLSKFESQLWLLF